MRYLESTEHRGVIELDDQRDFLVWRRGSGGTVEILDITVGSERRKGKGRKLVRLLMRDRVPADCPLIFAITRADNLIAQQFYEALHWRVVGVLRDFYGINEPGRADAIMYGRNPGSLT